MRKLFIQSCFLFIIFGCKKNTETIGGTVTIDKAPRSGNVLFSPFANGDKSGQLIIVDQDGKLITDRTTPDIALNFQKWNINGEVRYSYMVEDDGGYHIPGFSVNIPGYDVIADENLNEIKRIYLQSYGNIDASVQNLADAHDFILLSDDHYILEAYYEKRVNNIPGSLHPAPDLDIAAPVIQEVENNQVIWQWDGSELPALYSESVEGNNFSDTSAVKDYLHLNSMTIDPNDGNLVCSFRNANLVMKINRTNGNMMWKLGGNNSSFPMTAEEKFLRQHHVSFTDNGSTLLVFDNGEINERPYSRVLEFQLDETNMQITNFKSFDIPESFTQFMGSVQKSGDTYFIGGGTASYILEVNYVTGEKTFEMKLDKSTYRSFKYE